MQASVIAGAVVASLLSAQVTAKEWTHIRFVVAKDAALDLSPDGVKGKRIGVQRAATNDKFLSDSYGSGVTIVRKQDNELREQLNGALRALRDNGTYQQINAKYFEYSIYGD